MGSWNVNGWTESNKLLRSEIIKKLNLDIICLSETHLFTNDVISLFGYTWFGHNRSVTHVRVNKASGGVGWLVKNEV